MASRRGCGEPPPAAQGSRSKSASPAAAGDHGRSTPLGLTASNRKAVARFAAAPARPGARKRSTSTTDAAQSAGACRAVTTSAARSQSSASASGRNASATQAPVGHRRHAAGLVAGHARRPARDPPASRGSASAASHSFTQKASLPVRIRCRWPSLPRTATLLAVTGNQDVRLRHRQRPDRRHQQHHRAGPAQRRAQQAQQDDPDARRDQRADPERRHAADRARQRRDPFASPRSSSRCRSPSATRTRHRSPNGIASRPSRPAGITTAETTGIAARLASTP